MTNEQLTQWCIFDREQTGTRDGRLEGRASQYAAKGLKSSFCGDVRIYINESKGNRMSSSRDHRRSALLTTGNGGG